LGRSVLLSVKPEFAAKILDGSKRWEFRRVLWQELDANYVYVYVSAPVKRVVARFVVSQVYLNLSKGICGLLLVIMLVFLVNSLTSILVIWRSVQP
jgi:hypothetical protein